jgi:hypothetical protein
MIIVNKLSNHIIHIPEYRIKRTKDFSHSSFRFYLVQRHLAHGDGEDRGVGAVLGDGEDLGDFIVHGAGAVHGVGEDLGKLKKY